MTEEKDEFEFVLPLDNFPSRNSSMNRSSRLYYRRTATEGVPFQWEMLPGTPKANTPLTEVVPPPISPPPALLSLRLQRPVIGTRVQNNKLPLFVSFGRWRKRSNSKKHSCPSDDDHLPRFGSCGSHCEFMDSPCNKPKSSSSSTSSSSSSLSLPLPSSSLPAAESSVQWRLGCGRWRINPTKNKIAIGRRV